jgi:hypothetical protein
VLAGLAGSSAAAPPSGGLLVPGQSLGGVRLGAAEADVLKAWGPRHGVCRDCPKLTWYFNSIPFSPQGTGVVFRHGRAYLLFTVWQPAGWHTPKGLRVGASVADVALDYRTLHERRCRGYQALVLPGGGAQTVFYVYHDALWGFGLMRPGAQPCL